MRYLLLIFALLLFFVWVGSFLIFHIVGALIHVFLILAIVLFVIHLVSGRRAA